MISQKLFFLLILLLPTQLGLHFWPDWASVFGIKVDYLAPTVYLTDLLVGGILISWWWENRKIFNFQFSIFNLFFGLFVYLLITSFFIAQNSGAALYKLVKVIEFILLGYYIYKTKPLFIIHYSLFIAMIYTSLIALAQFFFQHTIGGPFYWLGERTFDVNTPGVALVNINGQDYLRPYATFSHPNALAGFLLAGLILLLRNGRMDKWRMGIFVLGLSTLILTFSHSAWIAGIVVLLVSVIPFLKKRLPLISKLVLIIAILGSFIMASSSDYSYLQERISRRIELSGVALQMFKNYPLTGVGLNNFVVRLPEYGQTPTISWFLQPVHNIFLLTLAETGLVGLGFLVWLLFKLIKKMATDNWQLITLLLAIILTGVIDHYWLTLQQNQLLLTIVVGWCFSAKNHRLKNQL